ncbi:MAG: RNA polymerase sigma factor [Phycisphaerales bacterium JB039]
MPEPRPQSGRSPAAPLAEREFAARLEADRRRLWTIAAAILGSPHDAEDVVQEASVIALGKLEQFQRDTSFLAWMGQIVRFVALNQMRRRQRDRAVAVEPDAVGAAPVDAPPVEGEFRGELLAAVHTLEETPRTCLLLRIVCEMSYREIAAAMEIPEGTAMSHVHRSRAALRKRLSRWESPLVQRTA